MAASWSRRLGVGRFFAPGRSSWAGLGAGVFFRPNTEHTVTPQPGPTGGPQGPADSGIVATVTDDLIARGVKAGDLVREVALIVGGGGGGRPNMAQAGGRDASKLGEALAQVGRLIGEQSAQN